MPQNSPYTLEICVDTSAALKDCVGMADRIELCAGLDVGGLTPSPGLMQQAKASGVETHVLIRPRSGDFQMNAADLAVAVADIQAVRDLGLQGVVIGAERDRVLDQAALTAMVEAAGSMDVTLHRVIDVLDDPISAMETAIALGFKRILTSGSASSAAEGIAGLNRLLHAADGRIDIMAGAGINSKTIGALIDQTGVASFHASCASKSPLAQRYVQFGFGEAERAFDREEMVRLASLVRQLNYGSPKAAPA